MQQTPFQPFFKCSTHTHTHTHTHTIQVNLALTTTNPISPLRSFVLWTTSNADLHCHGQQGGGGMVTRTSTFPLFNVFIVISLLFLFVVSNNKTFEVSCYGNGYGLAVTTAITLLNWKN